MTTVSAALLDERTNQALLAVTGFLNTAARCRQAKGYGAKSLTVS
jgi:hypothetical protein